MVSLDSRREHWAGIVAEQQASGLSAARWCRENKIETNNFYNWRKRLMGTHDSSRCHSNGAGTVESPSAQWLALGVDASNARPTGLTLRVGRVSIDLTQDFDRRLLADVLGVIESRSGVFEESSC